MLKVDDPKQNQHSWCGILSVDLIEKQIPVKPGAHVFLKTSRDAHFVAQGTIVKNARELIGGALEQAIDDIVSTLPDPIVRDEVRKQILEDIKTCQDEVNTLNGGNVTEVVEMLDLDFDEACGTSPLINELNIRTEFLFRDEMWLGKYGERVRADKIRIGRRLPCLPKSS
ncbi:MAG TPA: hypothetical protein VFW11_00120 [Cyclobacteriaceae bacterium]|nr:hypothetical protein [Cyclobacteriaceae bacterium]